MEFLLFAEFCAAREKKAILFDLAAGEAASFFFLRLAQKEKDTAEHGTHLQKKQNRFAPVPKIKTIAMLQNHRQLHPFPVFIYFQNLHHHLLLQFYDFIHVRHKTFL